MLHILLYRAFPWYRDDFILEKVCWEIEIPIVLSHGSERLSHYIVPKGILEDIGRIVYKNHQRLQV